MKKILGLMLAAATVVSFTACKNMADNFGVDNLKEKAAETTKNSEENTDKAAETEEKSEKNQISKEDLSDLTATAFEIEGEYYSFPCDWHILLDNGWEFTYGEPDNLKETKVEPGKVYTIGSYMSLNGEEKIKSLSFANLTDKEITMGQCQLYGISLYGDNLAYSSDSKCKFKLFGELDENLTYEDVIRVMGSKANEDDNPYFRISDYYDPKKGGSVNYYSKSDEVKYNYSFHFNEDNTLQAVDIGLPASVMQF